MEYLGARLGWMLALLAVAAPAPSRAAPWEAAPSLSRARADAGATTWQGRIYVAGGRGWRGTSPRFEVLEPGAQAWRLLSPLPIALQRPGLVAVGGRIYAIAGYRNVWRSLSERAWVYDPDTDRWQEIASLPRPRGEHALVVSGERIYAIAGRGADSDRIWSYLPARDRWEQLPTRLPLERYDVAAVALDGRIYLIGGRAAGIGDLARVDVFDLASATWSRVADLPEPRSRTAAVAFAGRIHVTGGEVMASSAVFARHWVYLPAVDRWKRGEPLPQARRGTESVRLADRWCVLGGSTRTGVGAYWSASDRVECQRAGAEP